MTVMNYWEVILDENVNVLGSYLESVSENDDPYVFVHEFCDMSYSVDVVVGDGTDRKAVQRIARGAVREHLKRKDLPQIEYLKAFHRWMSRALK